MPRTTYDYINEIHREIWQETDENNYIEADQIEKVIKKNAGYSVVDKYWEGLKEFDKIKQVNGEQKWKVEKPKTELDVSGEMTSKHIKAPKEVIEEADKLGINYTQVLTQAILDEINSKQRYMEEVFEEDFTEEEVDYIFTLVKENLYSKRGGKEKRTRENNMRSKLFRDITGRRLDTPEKRDRLEELRQKAVKLKDRLEV